MLYIGYGDARKYIIESMPLVILFALGCLHCIIVGSYIDSLLGMLMGFGIGFLFFMLGGMGGGDGKLMAVLGVWLGWQGLYYVILIASCIGLIWGVIKLYRANQLKERFAQFGVNVKLRFLYGTKGIMEFEKIDDDEELPKSMVPYGTCLALATITLYLAKEVWYICPALKVF